MKINNTNSKKESFPLTKFINLIVILLFCISLSSIFVSSESYAVFEFNESSLENFFIAKNDFFHQELFIEPDYRTSQTISFFDSTNKLLLTLENPPDRIVLKSYLVEGLTKITSSSSNDSFLVSFCNNNGVCEQTFTVSENSFSCDDCASGSSDNYCDLVVDDICDPDCDNFDSDCNCEICFYDDMPLPLFCKKDYSGELCNQTCMGDSVNTFDGVCCLGNCVDSVFNQIPSGVFQESYGDSVLSMEELISQEIIEAEMYGTQLDELINDEYVLPPDTSILEVPIIYDESHSSQVGHVYEDATVKEKVYSSSNVFVDAVSESSGVQTTIIVMIIITILTIIFSIFFVTAHKKNNINETNSKIYSFINFNIKKGYTYEQIKQTLIKMGYPTDLITKQLMNHYKITLQDQQKLAKQI